MPYFEEGKMIECTSYDLTEWGQPFKKCTKQISEPSGTQVLVKVTAAGLCHSDLHIKPSNRVSHQTLGKLSVNAEPTFVSLSKGQHGSF